MKTAFIALALLAASAQAQVSCQRIGAMTACSDGTTYNHIGNSTFGSDGSSSQRIGNSTFGSTPSGGSWSGIGNSAVGTDSGGSWNAQRIGNTTIINGSGGRSITCQKIGLQTICN